MSVQQATIETGADKKRAEQPIGIKIPVKMQKPEIIEVVSEKTNEHQLQMFVYVKEDTEKINLNLKSFIKIPQDEIELIMLNRVHDQLNLESKEVQDQYPVIDLNKILSAFFYEQRKMWKHSIFKEMNERQKFAVFYIYDDAMTLWVARFLIGTEKHLILSVHRPDQIPFLFDGGFIGSEIERDEFHTNLFKLEQEKRDSITENIFLFIKEIIFSKN